YVFGVPGEEILDIVDSLADSRVRFVPTRHEQGAAFMANIYGRLTGRAGVCFATLGPGATNLATGIADANMDRAPLVAVTGQIALSYAHKEYHQYVDVVNVLRPLTKWNSRIEKPETIPESVRKAFNIAELEKPGACHLELPEDIADASAAARPLRRVPREEVRPSTAHLKEAAELINKSRQPIILAGAGVARTRATGNLRKLVDKYKIRVVHTYMGKGAVSDDDHMSLYAIGLDKKGPAFAALEKADIVIGVGYDFVDYPPEIWNGKSNSRAIVNIDKTPAEIDMSYQPQVQLVGSINDTLQLLTNYLDSEPKQYEDNTRRELLKEMQEGDSLKPMKPRRVLQSLRKILGHEDILVTDVGEHKNWISRLFPTYEPLTVLISNGYSSMGIGVPGGLAAKLVHPEKNVVVACGDGGFLMTCSELETAHRLGIDYTIVVFRDSAFGSIQRKQLAKFGRATGVSFGNPDLVRLAESFNAKGYRPENTSELDAMLEEATALRKLAV
ncbi:MAG TPA: acetolactate synthase large subunit, partial [Candidatus Binatus sp.]|nr:acetolactate synthase large subunit [Candidatus Binatus sp.]